MCKSWIMELSIFYTQYVYSGRVFRITFMHGKLIAIEVLIRTFSPMHEASRTESQNEAWPIAYIVAWSLA